MIPGRGPLKFPDFKNRPNQHIIRIQYFLARLDNDRSQAEQSRDAMYICYYVQFRGSCLACVVVFACWCYTHHSQLRDLLLPSK